MRIHTDDPQRARQAVEEALKVLPGVEATVRLHGSRSRRGAINLTLTGSDGRTGYRVNSGTQGPGYRGAASWDEWGVVLAFIFDADPDAFVKGVYAGADDFHDRTADRFEALALPPDSHPRHVWTSGSPRFCKKCSAEWWT
jgi:hypothetical protein